MGDESVKKQLTDSSSGRDFISHLPHHIKDNILVRLPTEQAVRTCVLSKEWRYAWCTVPKLVVFEKRNVDEESDYDCSKYVDMLLSNHKGPINKFALHMDDPRSEDLDRWITVLGSKGVKDLDLAFDDDDHEIPRSLFSCLLDLTDLKLRGCILNMPKDFKGFKLLRNIELDWVTFIGGDLEKLISSCPRLEDLKLVNESECLGNVVIRSQSLEMLTVFSDFKHLLIEAPKLFAFYISPEEYGNFRDFKTVHGEFITIFKREICCRFIVRHHINTTPSKLPIQLNYLTSTIITIDLSKEDDHAAALCMFKIAPRLQELYIKFTAGEGPPCISFWKSENGDDLFSSLKTITISSIEIDAAALILGFVAFVLRTAPVLEKMVIRDMGIEAVMSSMKNPQSLQKVSQDRSQQEGMRFDLMTIFEVLKFPRLSNKATVEFLEDNHKWLYGDSETSSDSSV